MGAMSGFRKRLIPVAVPGSEFARYEQACPGVSTNVYGHAFYARACLAELQEFSGVAGKTPPTFKNERVRNGSCA